MKKFFVTALVGLTFGLMPAGHAEVAPIEANISHGTSLEFCGYAQTASKKRLLRKMIEACELKLKENPYDAKVRHELAELWHTLGKVYCDEESYNKALDAFDKALELEPDNEQFKKDRAAALSDKKNKPPSKEVTPNFSGLS